MFWNIKPKPQGLWILSEFLILVLLGLSLGTIQGTLGKFVRSFTTSDSAAAAKFDVAVTAPEEFWLEQGEYTYEYYFLSKTDVRGLNFQIHNNGEVDVLCTPHINNGIIYRFYVAGEESTEFIVKAKETVDFWLVIAPAGLDTAVKNTALFVDIRQAEGG